MKIQAITVCVNYGDFLAETIKYNLPAFDDWLIVTEPSDEETREVCRRYNIQCLLSEDGKREKAEFSKGRLIERGLRNLSGNGWRLHIDADIVLPHGFRHRLKSADLQEDHIYGIDRLMVTSWSQWKDLLKTGYVQHGQFDYHCRLRFPAGVQMGSRWTHAQFGYVPIGYFQLWHSSQDEWRGIRVKSYPMDHNTACRTDVQHGLQWDRNKRSILPELVGIHLESELAQLGANWKGRKTKRFGPEAQPAGPINPHS